MISLSPSRLCLGFHVIGGRWLNRARWFTEMLPIRTPGVLGRPRVGPVNPGVTVRLRSRPRAWVVIKHATPQGGGGLTGRVHGDPLPHCGSTLLPAPRFTIRSPYISYVCERQFPWRLYTTQPRTELQRARGRKAKCGLRGASACSACVWRAVPLGVVCCPLSSSRRSMGSQRNTCVILVGSSPGGMEGIGRGLNSRSDGDLILSRCRNTERLHSRSWWCRFVLACTWMTGSCSPQNTIPDGGGTDTRRGARDSFQSFSHRLRSYIGAQHNTRGETACSARLGSFQGVGAAGWRFRGGASQAYLLPLQFRVCWQTPASPLTCGTVDGQQQRPRGGGGGNRTARLGPPGRGSASPLIDKTCAKSGGGGAF